VRLLRKFKRIAALISCLAFFGANGGHWAILQSVAWAEMWVHYAHTETVVQAATKTFDGKHPCTMCKRIARQKSKEKKQDITLTLQKFSFAKLESVSLTFPLSFAKFRYNLSFRLLNSQLTLSPPTPPPQAASIS
jgi:hypothetical protein